MSERNIYEEIGRHIRTARLSKQMTQDELCEKIALSRATISNIELGKHRIQIHVLYQLADIFEVNVHELFV